AGWRRRHATTVPMPAPAPCWPGAAARPASPRRSGGGAACAAGCRRPRPSSWPAARRRCLAPRRPSRVTRTRAGIAHRVGWVLEWRGRASGVAAPVRRRRGLRRWLPATAAVLLAGVAALLWSAWSPGTVHKTARGQILRVALEDGSTVTLDAETRLRVRYTAH